MVRDRAEPSADWAQNRRRIARMRYRPKPAIKRSDEREYTV